MQAASTQLTLRRLPDERATEVTSARSPADGCRPSSSARSSRSAEGNPFYLEELTRALVEEGVLLRGDSEVRLARPLSEIRVPATVQEVLAARLDRLGGTAKRVVQVASVIGRQFRRAELAKLLGTDEACDRSRARSRSRAAASCIERPRSRTTSSASARA